MLAAHRNIHHAILEHIALRGFLNPDFTDRVKTLCERLCKTFGHVLNNQNRCCKLRWQPWDNTLQCLGTSCRTGKRDNLLSAHNWTAFSNNVHKPLCTLLLLLSRQHRRDRNIGLAARHNRIECV